MARKKGRNHRPKRNRNKANRSVETRPEPEPEQVRDKGPKDVIFLVIVVVAVLIVAGGIVYIFSNDDGPDDDPDPGGGGSDGGDGAGSSDTYTDENGLTWYSDHSKGIAAANAAGKPVLIDFYTDWCTWCTVMDEDTYSDPGVKSQLSRFILIKVDGDMEQELVKNYEITGYPTAILLGSDGAEADRVVGYSGPEEFVQVLYPVS